jgi:hypothetical protein
MRGNGTNCIRIVPYSAVQFGSYNFYKKVAFLRHICRKFTDLIFVLVLRALTWG